ncbi:MAG: FG-GAP-like repeat-containing protein, partial [Akkermansiaceae bacterium]|nr:FG-GAP-like repeat-containing protein [Akkermansiaceae bacterium]
MTVQPRPGGGTQAKASAVILLGQFNRSLGFLASVTDSGSGYTSFPGVRVVSNAGSGASVSVFSMSGGRVGFVTALPGGSGYSDDATVVIDPPHTGDFQAALDNAAATEIQLEEGLYFQNAEISRDLVIRGRGMGRTVVSGGLLGSVIKILPLASGVRTVRLEDLTLIDGLALNGGGIDNNGARLTLERVEIRGCRAYGPAGEGGAIYNYGGAVLRLIDCHLHHNIASRAGGAISNSGINTSFLPVAAGATDRASAVIQDFFTDFAAVPVPQVAPEIDPATFNPANPPALPDRNAQADSMLGQVEGLVKGVTDTIGDVPALFESLAGETFEASGWGDMKSPTTELVRTRIENNQTGFANGVAKAELTVYEPTYAYRYLGNLNGAYEPGIDSFVTRTVSVPDQRVIGFGGGVHNDLGLLTIKDCDIRDNEVHTLLGSFGGAVSSVLGAVLVKNSRLNENLVRSNTVLASGGAVHGFASYISAEDSELNRNEADVVLFLSSGGAVKNTALGFARFLRCEVDENISGGGGGIANDYLARLEMAGCSISKNSVSGIIGAYGGGVRNENGGLVVLDSCTVAENRASGKAKGAGLYNQCEMTRLGPDEAPIIPIFFSEMVVRNSTLSGNNAFGKGLFDIPLEALGGGIYNGAFNLGIARLSIFSSTIAGNIAEEGIQQRGGGLYATPLSSLKISPSGNVPGLSLVTIANTIFAQNQPSNIASLTGASITSQGFNLSSDGTGPSGFTRNTDPLLAPLGPNGGPTLTHALLPGSPARDAGSPDGAIDPEKAPLTDQRGVTRSLGGRRDIGAFESVPPTLFADSFTALEDFPLTRDPRRGLLANDFGDNLTVTGVTQPAHGTVTFTPRGGFTYTPNANFTGLDSFFYQVVDANGVTGGPMQVSIQVDPVLDLLAVHPSAHSLFTDLDQPITLTFDEPVEVFRVLETVRLEGRLGGRIAFTATTSGNTATLTPTGGFQPGDRVTLRLTTALRGASGSPFLAPVQRRFDVGQRFGSGEFGPGASPDDHPGPRSLLIDLNNDGHLDLVTSSTGNSVWFNDGTGTMVPTGQALTCPRDRNLPVAGIALAAGDLNGDETPDLVLVTDDIRGRNVIWFNDGGGRFSQSRDDLIIDSSRTALGTSNYVPASDVAIGDLNNDGHADILIASHDVQFTGFTHVFLGNGRGGFARSGPSLGFIPGRGAVGVRSARLTDIDGDGDLDAILCLVNFNGGGMQIQLNNGDATFQSNGAVFG